MLYILVVALIEIFQLSFQGVTTCLHPQTHQVCGLKSQTPVNIDKLAETYKRLFNDEPPKGYKTPLDKNNHPELDTSEILE